MEEPQGIQLGFLEKVANSAWLEPRFFPSKVGGKPVWINPKDLPNADSMKCLVCKDSLCFLLQIYSPLTLHDDSYHRMLYLFCCRRGMCLKKDPTKAYKVLRSQLPAENQFYEDADEEDQDKQGGPMEENTSSEQYQYRKRTSLPLCSLCGQHGDKKCGGCLKYNYCSETHQRLHWIQGRHSKHCKVIAAHGSPAETSLAEPEAAGGATQYSPTELQEALKPWIDDNPLLFLEYEIITEHESEAKEKRKQIDEEKQKKMLENYYAEMEEEKNSEATDTEFKEVDLPKNQVDEEFLKFQIAIDIEPSQVLRYAADLSCKPLWISTKGIIPDSEIPKCGICGSNRLFELQILPQLIYHLKVERNLPGGDSTEEIDWGTLLVYTCAKSCKVDASVPGSTHSGAYAFEYLTTQDYSE